MPPLAAARQGPPEYWPGTSAALQSGVPNRWEMNKKQRKKKKSPGRFPQPIYFFFSFLTEYFLIGCTINLFAVTLIMHY